MERILEMVQGEEDSTALVERNKDMGMGMNSGLI